MVAEYKNCLRAVAERNNGKPIDGISEEDLSVLKAANDGDYLGGHTCPVGDCATRYEFARISGKLVVMGFDVVTGEQPCTDD